MNTMPESENTNCCHPEHACGFAAPAQAEVEKVFVLSCSEKGLAPGGGSVTLVTPLTLGNDPTAEDIEPDDAWAA
jgi:hypothetical protein